MGEIRGSYFKSEVKEDSLMNCPAWETVSEKVK